MIDALITPEAALDALGGPFVRKFGLALDETRENLRDFAARLPSSWHPQWTDRTLAGVIHDRLWFNLTADIEDAVPGVSLSDNGTTRTLCIDDRIALRVKRHTEGGQISGYRTKGSSDFYMGTLAGMELEHLAIGYEWLRDTREIGRGVLSKQWNTNADPVWVIGMQTPDEGVLHLPYDPIIPPKPEFDLSGIIAAEAEEANSR